MGEIKTSRPFRERFLDGFERSRLREEVQKVKPKRFNGLRKKYTGWALGGAIAIGGLSVPMKMADDAMRMRQTAAGRTSPRPGDDVNRDIQRDLTQAKSIADQVAGGVQTAAGEIGATVTQAPQAVASTVQQVAPTTVGAIQRAFFEKEVPFGGIIYDEAKKNDLPPELVAAVVQQESSFHPTARSDRGAIGLMQLVPRTGRWMGAGNLTNPAQNISAGAKYLRYLTDQFGGDQQKVIAAFNAGEGNVRRFGGIPPFRETRNYVQRVSELQRAFLDRLTGETSQQVADLGQ